MYNIAVFASGGGSNLQAIMDGCKSGRLNAHVCVVISNNSSSMALERARREGIPAFHFSQSMIQDEKLLEQTVLDTLIEHGADLIFLAGYMKKVSPAVLETYKGRVYNIHPALLPKYGGKGMYGINVHKAVLAAGEKETGITIHHVAGDVYDEGEIIAQKRVPVLDGDTPEVLAARVLEQEHIFIVDVLSKII